ncbi:Inositol-tetrakisphosphate 1-kinase 1 [uncultured virus]|nr:Inositol-tetrakisphosphate 1-kinase 1 [uncultured virus]
MNIITIGSFIEDNRFDLIIKYLETKEFKVVKLDNSQNYQDQGKFSLIIHKIKDNNPVKYAKIQDYSLINPECIILDNVESILLINNRISLSRCLKNLNFIFEDNVVCFPTSWIVDNNETSLDLVEFPAIIKPSDDNNPETAHVMALVYNIKGFNEAHEKLGSNILAQKFINHDGVLYKIYCIGESVNISLRPSLQNTFYDYSGSDCIFYGRVSKYEDPTLNLITKLPSLEFIRKLCGHIGNIFGINIFGIDLIKETNSNCYFVIDINHFPSFVGVSDVPEAFYDLIQTQLTLKSKQSFDP